MFDQILEKLASIATIVGAVLIIFQLKQSDKIAFAEHERQKKQSTIEFFNKINEETSTLRREVRVALEKSPDVIDSFNAETSQMLRRYLTLMEHFCVGITTGVYDLGVLFLLAGSSIIELYDQIECFIQKQRDDRSAPTIYAEYCRTVERLKRLKDKEYGDVVEGSTIKSLRYNPTISGYNDKIDGKSMNRKATV